MTRRVLVPYDGSDQSQLALEYAVETVPDGSITVLSVVEPFADYPGVGDDAAEGDLAERVRAQIETDVEQFASDIEVAVVYGQPVREILEHVERNPIDHVVMGSHGRDGATRLLLGSIAESVVRRASVPVTVVREGTARTGSVEDVLVPFDGSVHARTALERAVEWYPDATVTALYVVYPPQEESLTGQNWRTDDHAREILETANQLVEGVRTESTEGDPAKTIVSYATEEGVDAVVMGSSGRDGLARLLLGSVSEHVVRRAPVPVTVVR